MSNQTLEEEYKLIKSIGEGSFGEVFLAMDPFNNEVAVKFGDKKKNARMKIEYQIYKHLNKHNVFGIPQIYDYLESNTHNIIVMQLLGPSLDDLFKLHNNKFSASTVALLGKQIVLLLEGIHKQGIIHRDIKPQNFLFDAEGKQIYIMDFGLSKPYIKNNKHIKFKNDVSLIGTARYASKNMHYGIQPSRRDDLESVGYMLIYFLLGVLPWQNLNLKQKQPKVKKSILDEKAEQMTIIKEIGHKLISTSLDELCKNVPNVFKKYLEYCRNLKFDETPDYAYLINLFDSSGIPLKFEWINN